MCHLFLRVQIEVEVVEHIEQVDWHWYEGIEKQPYLNNPPKLLKLTNLRNAIL